MVICLERGADGNAYGPADATATSSLVAFLLPAYPGCPGKKAVKRMQQ